MNEPTVYPVLQLGNIKTRVLPADHCVSSVMISLSKVTIHLPTLQDQGIENLYILTI